MSTLAPGSWFLLLFYNKKEPRLLGEKADSRAGPGNDKLSLECLVVLGSKEVLSKKTSGWSLSKGHTTERAPMAKAGTI